MVSRSLFLTACLILLPAAALAQQGVGDARSQVHLIDQGRIKERPGERLAGIEIILDGDTKTYWRYPGDAGVPPTFDWSGSDNVAKIDVMWPVPKRFTDGGGESIGYSGRVTLPVRVTAQNPDKPMTLKLLIDYAICNRLCVPVKGADQLSLISEEVVDEAAALAAVPTTEGRPGYGVTLLGVDTAVKPNVLDLGVEVPSKSKDVDLFAEGPSDDWALPLPKAVPTEPKPLELPSLTRKYKLPLEGVPKSAAISGTVLTFTLSVDGAGMEAKVPLP